MLLRLRIRLPDRPGSLGQVARTLGVVGADIVAVVVLERAGGRAVDDVTVIWPAGVPTDRIVAGLGAVPGVALDGLWSCVGATGQGGADAELIGQVAANPVDGVATLVDAVPGLLCADWAAALVLPAQWAQGEGYRPAVVYASWRAPVPLEVPEVTPMRPRTFDGPGLGPGTVRYAAAPFGRAGLVLLAARGGDGTEPGVPAFHVTEVDRLAQLVRAAGIVLGERLDAVSAPGDRLDAVSAPGEPVASVLPGTGGG